MWVLLIVIVGINGQPKVSYVDGFKTDVECLKVAKRKTAGVRASSACILVSVEQ